MKDQKPCAHPGCMSHVTHPCERCGIMWGQKVVRKDKRICICCGSVLGAEPTDDPLTISPVYGGLIFRSSGNFGSTIFDPMPIGIEDMLEVIICDKCIKKNTKRVIRIYNIQRSITSECERFTP